MKPNIVYHDAGRFHCEHSFMAEYQRRELRHRRVWVVALCLLTLALGLLAAWMKG